MTRIRFKGSPRIVRYLSSTPEPPSEHQYDRPDEPGFQWPDPRCGMAFPHRGNAFSHFGIAKAMQNQAGKGSLTLPRRD